MAQRPTQDFNIDPNVTSGTDLANILNRFQDAIDSGNSGASRPAYLDAGGLWVREGDPMRLYLYDGTTDRELYNTTDGLVGGSQWKDNGNDIYYSDGNVGIGTDNPAFSLDVTSSNGTIRNRSASGAAVIRNQSSGVNYTKIETAEDGQIDVKQNETSRLTVSSLGNVGIDTSEPAARLHINPASLSYTPTPYNSTVSCMLSRAGGGAALQIATENTGSGGIWFTDNETNENSSYIQYDHGAQHLRFGVEGERTVTIDGDGNMGLGMLPLRQASEAKEQLEDWKSAIEERMKAEPKADRSAVTQEITGFDKLPTLEETKERLERNAGDKLQVNGNISASGSLSTQLYNISSQDIWTTNGSGMRFSATYVYPLDGSGTITSAGASIGSSGRRFNDVWLTGNLYPNGGITPATTTRDLIETLSTLRNATKDEETLEGLRDAIGDAVGGLIQKFEAIQAEAEKAATMDIEE